MKSLTAGVSLFALALVSSCAIAQATRPAATQPAAAPVPPVAAVVRNRMPVLNARAQRDAQRQNIRNTPDGGTFKLDDLVHFNIVDGRLESEWVGKLTGGQPRLVKIEGSDAAWLINRFNNGANAFYTLSRFDFDAPDDDFWMITSTFQQGLNVTTVYAQGGDANEVLRLYYTQQNETVMFNLSGPDNNNRLRQILTASATDLHHLRADHPDEVRRYLAPILRKITGQPVLQPGAGDVYCAFTGIAADPVVTGKIEALLPGLSSVSPEERERATQSLRELGRAGVLAAMRFDQEGLSPEQANRLHDLVTSNTRLSMQDPARDTTFLLDCFEDDDLAVRVSAKAAVEGVLGEAVAFNPKAALNERIAAGDALRRKLMKDAAAKSPADAPAEPQPAAPLRPAVLRVHD